MINYIKSENYRLLRKKSLHLISLICLFLIAAAAFTLYYSLQIEPDFPYGTSSFFYSNVIGTGVLIVIVGFLFNLALTGKDLSIVKQSVSFGISRNVIFWTKLIVTLGYFLFICAVGILLVIGLGENLFSREDQSITNFVTAALNMLPLILSGFLMVHTLRMLKVGEVWCITVLLVIFGFSGDLLRVMLRPVSGLNELYQLAPSTLLNTNLMSFMGQAAQFDYRYWLTGLVISVLFLLVGAMRFSKQTID